MTDIPVWMRCEECDGTGWAPADYDDTGRTGSRYSKPCRCHDGRQRADIYHRILDHNRKRP